MAFGVKLEKSTSFLAPFLLGGTSAMVALFLILALMLQQAKGGVGLPHENGGATPPLAEKTKAVILSSTDISPGTFLTRDMFRMEERRVRELPSTALVDLAAIDKVYAKTFISANVPLVPENIVQTRTASLLTQRIPEGHRAVTILVDMRSAVEGWVLPGARVDVVWTTSVNDERTLRVIVENAEVLSAERQTDPNSNTKNVPLGIAPIVAPTTVTLLVSTEDAQKVHFASTSGVLGLSLRGSTDRGSSANGGSITLPEMLGIAPSADRVEGQVAFRDSKGKEVRLLLKNDSIVPANG